MNGSGACIKVWHEPWVRSSSGACYLSDPLVDSELLTISDLL